MRISAIVAMDRDGAIGRENKLLWHIPEDLKRFKALTYGRPVIMGRKTHEAIGKPLIGRTNIVISGTKENGAGVVLAKSLQEAVDHAELLGVPEVFIIGGASIYEQAICLNLIDRLYITWVGTKVESADAFFPIEKYLASQWHQVDQFPGKESHPLYLEYFFSIYDKVREESLID